MTGKRKTLFAKASLTAVLSLMVMPLLYAGQAGALYPPNGSKPDGAGGHMNPGDGMCVVGLAADGTMRVDWSIANARDCAAYTTGLTGMTNAAACTVAGGPGNDGWKHTWATSNTCVNAATPSVAIALTDLDRTLAMCKSKGGTTLTPSPGTCVAYGWLYRNRKADGPPPTLPISGTGISTTDGVQSTDGLGFCYASMDMTSGTYADRGTCPSKHNNVPPVAVNVCKDTAQATLAACQIVANHVWTAAGGYCIDTSKTSVTCTGGTLSWVNLVAAGVAPALEWNACASNPVAGCQTQASYDAGLGWSLPDSGAASITTGAASSTVVRVCKDASRPTQADCEGLRCAGGANKGLVCTVATEGVDCPGSTCVGNERTAATTVPGEYYWDPILGGGTCINSSLTTTGATLTCKTGGPGTPSIVMWADNNRCNYAFGQKGKLAATLLPANSYTRVGTGTTVDLSTITNQGDCLAAGASWDNWLPSLGTTVITPAEDANLPAGAQIVKLDAVTSVEGGGGEFFSGTGFNCLKCHSDQSRAYQERQKPGFVKTRHQMAGDNLSKPFAGYFTAGSSSWGLQGVQCAMCHSTAKPAQDDLIQVVPAGVTPSSTQPPPGAPKSATGHNQTEYGAHLLDICYTCHGSPANPPTTNPASVIPVSAGDFALTSNLPGPPTSLLGNANCTGAGAPVACCTGLGTGTCTPPPQTAGLAPIANQFLNSPHAKYTGSSTKVDIGNKSNYGSTFEGWVCRSSNSIGGGNILTTVYRSGVAEKIPNLDSTTNAACTNPGNGSATSGAEGFWVKDGETSPGVPTDTAQGNCMTCHDVHWALADTDPEAESFRRECPTCHVNSGASASVAPQIDLTKINHLKTAGTPLENWLTEPEESCEICHMPKSGGSSSSPMHLWRINPDASYETMGSSQANTAAEMRCAGGVNAGNACAINVDCPSSTCNTVYANAAWVDIPHACGQCHGTDGLTATVAGVPPRSTAQLAAVAKGMHDGAGVTYSVTFTTSTSGLTANVTAAVGCTTSCPTFTYDWDWGDSTAHGSGASSSHLYGSAGSKSITLTVTTSGKLVGSTTRSVTVTAPDNPPVASGTCTWNANTWTMSVHDTSTDDNAVQTAVVVWGDSSSNSVGAGGSTFTHTYLTPGGPYTPTVRAIDASLQSNGPTACTGDTAVSPAYFAISGTVYKHNGTTPVPSAAVTVKKGSAAVKTVYTLANGTFSAGSLKPGAYTLVVTKAGYTFTVPAATITVGPSSAGNNISAVTP